MASRLSIRRDTLSGRRLCDHCKEKATVKFRVTVKGRVRASYGCAKHERDAKKELEKGL